MEKDMFYKYFQKILREGEEIRFLIDIHSPPDIKKLLSYGISKFWIDYFTLIFTKERMFCVPWFKGEPFNCAIIQINFSSLKEIKIIKNKLKVKYLNGKEETILKFEKNKIEEILKAIESIDLKEEKDFEKEKSYLCPNCISEIKKGDFTCSNCGCKFKNRGKAIIRSIIIPGGAYFYFGFIKLGLYVAFCEILLLVLCIYFTALILKNNTYMIFGLIPLLITIIIHKIDSISKALSLVNNLIKEGI